MIRKTVLLVLFCLLAAPLSAFQGVPLPDAQQQQFGATGLANAAGFVCTYAAGTTTPLATYSDVTLVTNAHNPIQLNAAGRPVAWQTATEIEVFAQARSYKVVVHAAGTGSTCNGTAVGAAISTRDNISGANIYTAIFATKNLDNVRQCDQFAGANAGVKIAACITDLPATGGTADARGFEGAQTLGTLTITKASVTVLFGAATYTGAITISSANAVSLIGIGPRATIIATAGSNNLTIRSSSFVTVRDLALQSTAGVSANAVYVLVQANGVSADYNVFDNVEVGGAARGATGTANTSKCFHFDSTTGGTAEVFFNKVVNSYINQCNTLIKLDAADSNANYFSNNTFAYYWKIADNGGVENIFRGNFVNQGVGASSSDPTIVFNLTGTAAYNDLEIPTGEPGANSQAIATAAGVVNNRFVVPCTLNYALGLTQTGALGNNGTNNAGIDQPGCQSWTYNYTGLTENHTYRLGSFPFPTSNTGADIWLQWDSRNATTTCTLAGSAHAYISNNAGTVAVTPMSVEENNNNIGGCASLSGWDISGTTVYPVFYNFDNGTATATGVANVSSYSSAAAATMARTLTDKGAGNLAPTTRVAANVATAQTKGKMSGTASLNFAAFAGNDCQDLTVTVTGVADGDAVLGLGIPAAGLLGGTVWNAWVTSASTVTVRQCKVTAGGSADPPAVTVRAVVEHY